MTKEVPELRIIEYDLWEQIQARKQRYSSRWGNKRQSRKRLFSGLLKCGCCGGGMTISRTRGRFEVTIVGALAQILAFAQKTTAALTGGGGTSLMVAGERNPLYRTLFTYPS